MNRKRRRRQRWAPMPTEKSVMGQIEREKLVIHNVIQLLLLLFLQNKTSTDRYGAYYMGDQACVCSFARSLARPMYKVVAPALFYHTIIKEKKNYFVHVAVPGTVCHRHIYSKHLSVVVIRFVASFLVFRFVQNSEMQMTNENHFFRHAYFYLCEPQQTARYIVFAKIEIEVQARKKARARAGATMAEG